MSRRVVGGVVPCHSPVQRGMLPARAPGLAPGSARLRSRVECSTKLRTKPGAGEPGQGRPTEIKRARVEAARRRAVVRANSKCVRAAASFGARAYEERRAGGRPVWSSKLQCIEPIRGRSPPQIARRGSSMRGNAPIAAASLACIRACMREGCGRGAAGRRRRRAPSTVLHETPSMEPSRAAIICARVTSLDDRRLLRLQRSGAARSPRCHHESNH